MWWGKVIGFIIGWMIGGFGGALVGLFLGYLYDSVQKNRFISHAQQVRQGFFDITFLVMGHIAKSDGRITEEELHAARQMMHQMNLNAAQRERAMHLYTEGKQENFDLDSALTKLIQISHSNFILLQLFTDVQLQAVRLSGAVNPEKQKILQHIFSRLGYRSYGFQYQHQSYERPINNTQADYQTLGVSPDASNDEIKKAYRRLMSQHHPDKLMAKGLPEEMLKLATEKAQQIQLAYDRIKKARGF